MVEINHQLLLLYKKEYFKTYVVMYLYICIYLNIDKISYVYSW